ncbi:MAG: hypothetical protein SPK80_09515 [Bacteroidales bacterium]|jgi:ferric-dicitrate binding protein FerR (iron transport regulator)|nr:hypothetical protein [Bacteroidales bacterium]MBR1636969.1 hypothetical protein [Bacteroidales bacterium]MBR1894862.1 hypothetical protein [Bacteroidales bacterium]MDY6464824.1 hypothetical protein [Bacteroidales bacterium]
MEKYKAWIDRYFDAALSPSEEAEFRRFLATTDDPAFDGVKAVMGYFAVESARRAAPARPARRWLAVAASVAVVAFGVGAFSWIRSERQACRMVLADGQTIYDRDVILADVRSTLDDFFNNEKAADIDGTLNLFFK